MWSTSSCEKRNASSGSFTSMSGASIGDSLSRLAYSLNTIHFHDFSQVISEVATSWTMAGHWPPTIVRWDSFSRYGSTSRTLWSLRFCDLPRHFRPFILPMISCITLSHYSMVTIVWWLIVTDYTTLMVSNHIVPHCNTVTVSPSRWVMTCFETAILLLRPSTMLLTSCSLPWGLPWGFRFGTFKWSKRFHSKCSILRSKQMCGRRISVEYRPP